MPAKSRPLMKPPTFARVTLLVMKIKASPSRRPAELKRLLFHTCNQHFSDEGVAIHDLPRIALTSAHAAVARRHSLPVRRCNGDRLVSWAFATGGIIRSFM